MTTAGFCRKCISYFYYGLLINFVKFKRVYKMPFQIRTITFTAYILYFSSKAWSYVSEKLIEFICNFHIISYFKVTFSERCL